MPLLPVRTFGLSEPIRLSAAVPPVAFSSLMATREFLKTEKARAFMRAYQERFQWKPGLGIKDWRWIVRLGSIDVSVLEADPTGATTNLIQWMVKMIHRLPNPAAKSVNLKFYVPRIVGEMLDVQAMNKTNLYLTVGDEEGVRKTKLRGIEICTLDAMTEAEALV